MLQIVSYLPSCSLSNNHDPAGQRKQHQQKHITEGPIIVLKHFIVQAERADNN